MYLFTNRSSYSACIRVLPLYPFDLPFFLHNCVRWRFAVDTWWLQCETYRSLRHSSHYALLTVLWNKFNIAEIEALWLSRIKIWGTRFTSIFSMFSIMAGWLAEIFWCCSLLILLCNGQNITEYEAYWLMGVPIINPWGAHQPFFLAKWYAQINQPKLCFQKSKQTSIRKNL